MESLLTERQQEELNKSILEYFMHQKGYERTVSALKQDANLENHENSKKGLLEKKWTAVVRLQKKIIDLENKLSITNSGNTSNRSNSNGVFTNLGDGKTSYRTALPREPADGNLTGHRGPITHVALHPTYTILASASEDSMIKIWDFETQQYERTLKGHTQVVTAISFNPNGSYMASSSSDMSIKIWELQDYTCTKTLRGHEHTVSDVQFTASGDEVVTCSRDQTIKTWDCKSGFCTKTLTGHLDWVRCLSISLDDVYIASGCSDSSIHVWAKESGQVVKTLRGHSHVIECIAFGKYNSSSGSSSSVDLNRENDGLIACGYLVSGGRDMSVKLWNVLNGECLFTFNDHDNWVRSVLIHPCGNYILSCSDDKSIRVLDIKEKRCARTIEDAHGHFVTSLAMSPINMKLISGSVDRSINIWSSR